MARRAVGNASKRRMRDATLSRLLRPVARRMGCAADSREQ
jgi:hypothetical protein